MGEDTTRELDGKDEIVDDILARDQSPDKEQLNVGQQDTMRINQSLEEDTRIVYTLGDESSILQPTNIEKINVVDGQKTLKLSPVARDRIAAKMPSPPQVRSPVSQKE